jgi:hypothetical protein
VAAVADPVAHKYQPGDVVRTPWTDCSACGRAIPYATVERVGPIPACNDSGEERSYDYLLELHIPADAPDPDDRGAVCCELGAFGSELAPALDETELAALLENGGPS